MTDDVEARDMKVSDAEREHVGQLLQHAVGQGRLTVGEFAERMDTAMAARTRSELNAVLLDLPVELAHMAPAEALELSHHMGQLTRRGAWQVPPRVRLVGQYGYSLLDFTDAVFTSPTVTLEIDKSGGSTKIIVPEGAPVDTTGLHVTMGNMKIFTVRRIEPGPVHFVITGRSTMGEVRIVRPRRWRLGPVTVHHPFRLSWGNAARRV